MGGLWRDCHHGNTFFMTSYYSQFVIFCYNTLHFVVVCESTSRSLAVWEQPSWFPHILHWRDSIVAEHGPLSVTSPPSQGQQGCGWAGEAEVGSGVLREISQQCKCFSLNEGRVLLVCTSKHTALGYMHLVSLQISTRAVRTSMYQQAHGPGLHAPGQPPDINKGRPYQYVLASTRSWVTCTWSASRYQHGPSVLVCTSKHTVLGYMHLVSLQISTWAVRTSMYQQAHGPGLHAPGQPPDINKGRPYQYILANTQPWVTCTWSASRYQQGPYQYVLTSTRSWVTCTWSASRYQQGPSVLVYTSKHTALGYMHLVSLQISTRAVRTSMYQQAHGPGLYAPGQPPDINKGRPYQYVLASTRSWVTCTWSGSRYQQGPSVLVCTSKHTVLGYMHLVSLQISTRAVRTSMYQQAHGPGLHAPGQPPDINKGRPYQYVLASTRSWVTCTWSASRYQQGPSVLVCTSKHTVLGYMHLVSLQISTRAVRTSMYQQAHGPGLHAPGQPPDINKGRPYQYVLASTRSWVTCTWSASRYQQGPYQYVLTSTRPWVTCTWSVSRYQQGPTIREANLLMAETPSRLHSAPLFLQAAEAEPSNWDLNSFYIHISFLSYSAAVLCACDCTSTCMPGCGTSSLIQTSPGSTVQLTRTAFFSR